MTGIDPLGVTWSSVQVEVMDGLRAWAVAFTELTGHMARWMDLPSSDANALGQIVWAAEERRPLSPAQLGRRIGMTSGATTVLINRLERDGHVTRSREHADRRRVTLRPTPAARARAHEFMSAASAETVQALLDIDPAALRTATEVLDRMTGAAQHANNRLAAANKH